MAVLRETDLACPFFVPLEIVNDGSWPHPSRLPLGAGWTGSCRASGKELPASDRHIHDFCNLGYASACPHLPPRRDWDAVRFSVARAGQDQVTIGFVCELAHAPIEYGRLTFDLGSEAWLDSHPDPRVLTLANCYLRTYRARKAAGIGMLASGAKAHDEEWLDGAAEAAPLQSEVGQSDVGQSEVGQSEVGPSAGKTTLIPQSSKC